MSRDMTEKMTVSFRNPPQKKQTKKHANIYIYIYVCVCVCVCVD